MFAKGERALGFRAAFRTLCLALIVPSLVSAPVFASAGASNGTLASFLRTYLRAKLPGIDKTTRIAVGALPNDDVAVFVSGHYWCGSGGCNLLILKRAGDSYTVLGHETIVHPPIRLLSASVKSEPQIGVMVGGGGVLPWYEAVLAYDGHAYPENPTTPPARRLNRIQGRVVISNDAYTRSGSTLLYASPASTRVVKFAGGEAIVERRGLDEHVVVERRERASSISDCDTTTGTYDQIVAFSAAVKNAARHDDRAALASFMAYPLRVNARNGKSSFVATKAHLFEHFDSVFDTQVLEKLVAMEPHDVFCRNGQSMFADGTLWASVGFDGKLRGTVVNAQ
jgi:hypothetical protein